MNNIRDILLKFKSGEISVEEAEKLLKVDAIEKITDIASIDINRSVRRGIAEIILAQGKTDGDLVKIVTELDAKSKDIIISKISDEQLKKIKEKISPKKIMFYDKARIAIIQNNKKDEPKEKPKIGIITAGTGDIPIAEESRVVAEYMGCKVLTAYDIGIAGIHRLFPSLKEMIEEDVSCIIVAAGMEGALPSVVAGIVDTPVIGLPTSIGYGFGGKGVGALYTMLQSCVTGLTVVNIDNGVSAGVAAALIAKRGCKK